MGEINMNKNDGKTLSDFGENSKRESSTRVSDDRRSNKQLQDGESSSTRTSTVDITSHSTPTEVKDNSRKGGQEQKELELENPLIMKRRKEASRQPWRHKMKASVSNLLYKTIQEFRSSGLCIDFNDVIVSGIAGTGAFATVYKGTYQNEEVAIKKLITQNSLPMSTKSLKDF